MPLRTNGVRPGPGHVKMSILRMSVWGMANFGEPTR